MRSRFSIWWVAVIWFGIGLVVAANKNYARSLDSASEIATFILAVILWPVPATDGAVRIQF
jgi:hypothetical protein